MINYTIKKGDTLSDIAYKYQTTISIIMSDNSIIENTNYIQAGWILKIRTSEEYAKEKAAAAVSATESAVLYESSVNLKLSDEGVDALWNGKVLDNNQTGIVNVTKNGYLYRFGSNGELVRGRPVQAGDSFKTYGSTDEKGGLYLLGGNLYLKKNEGSFVVAPVINPSSGSTYLVGETVETQKASTPVSSSNFSTPQFEMPGHRRPILQVKKDDGKYVTMELRVTSVTKGYSSQFTPNQTNAGYMIGVGGKNLTVLTVTGYFLDTKTNREAEDFLERYEEYFTPVSSDNYFRSALATFVHKGREYKGMIPALNLTDQSDNPLDQKFSMQYLVLKEKKLSSTQMKQQYLDKVIDRKGQNERAFLSDLNNMLANPITSKIIGN